jgi:hypothetical protein
MPDIVQVAGTTAKRRGGAGERRCLTTAKVTRQDDGKTAAKTARNNDV